MKKLIFIPLLFLIATSCKTNKISGNLIITNVNIIDIEKSVTLSKQNIIVNEGKITAILPYSERDEIIAETKIDGTDKFVIPGLWDMHAHDIASEGHNFGPLCVANGVLGVRDMRGNLEVRDSLVASNSINPKIYLAGATLYGDVPFFPMRTKDVEGAIKTVDSLHEKGADFIKVHEFLSEDQIMAIAKRCKELEIPFAGHVPMHSSAKQVSELGQKSIEHLSGITEYISTETGKIDNAEIEMFNALRNMNQQTMVESIFQLHKLYTAPLNKDKLDELITIFKDNNTYIVTTLVIIKATGGLDSLNVSTLPNLQYFPHGLRESWKLQNRFPFNMFKVDDWKIQHELVKQFQWITQKLYENQVPIMAGTDSPLATVMPGFSLHDELQNFVDCGMTNADALKTATIVPAEYLGISDLYGTITVNKVADFVLLDKNPLEQIENTKVIFGVIYNGKYLDKEKLNEILRSAEISKE